MRLIFITQRVDPDDPVLGATVSMIAALAARCDELVVLTDHAIPDALPGNCRVRTFAARSRVGRGARFEAALLAELGPRGRPVAVIAHMCPIYAVLAAPIARPLGVRILLWYAHWNSSRTLELAARVSHAVVSVDASSVPLSSAKVVGIGHGIDLDQFPCGERGDSHGFRAVVLGRYSRTKGIETIVRAVVRCRVEGLDVTLQCHGPTITPAEDTDKARLQALVAELGAEDAVTLGGPLPRGEIAGALAAADVLINNHRSGAPDKVVYEACAACCPVIVANPSFDELFTGLQPRLRFPVDDAVALAECISALATLDSASRTGLGSELRRRVAERHSVASWADAIVGLATRPSTSS